MKHIKKYGLFCEGYEEIMSDMTSDINFKEIDKSNLEIEKLKDKIDAKKTELETTLDQLDKLQIEGMSAENIKELEEKKKIISTTVDRLKAELKTRKDSIQIMKDNIA